MAPRPPAGLTAFLESARRILADPTVRLMALGALVGVLGGLAAGGFDLLLRGFGELLLGTASPAVDRPVWWRAGLGPVAGGLVAGAAIHWGTVSRRPYDIPAVMDAAWNRDGRLPLRGALATAVAASASVGGGQSGGREGPIVQLSGAAASALCRAVGLPRDRARVLVAAGAAAGIAASFDTPIGGAFFALEILLGNFALQMFGPVVAATVAGTVVGQVLLGDRVALALPPFALKHPGELPLYLLLGLLCGLIAVLLKQGLGRGAALVDRYAPRPALRPAAAGVVVGVMGALGVHGVMGNGYSLIEALLSGPNQSVGVLAGLLGAKLLATLVTARGAGGSGLFAPTLVIGALTGMLFGEVAHGAWPDMTDAAGAYGMVGMGAMVAATVHAPLTIALMLFEMTGNYAIVLPTLLAIAVAGLVSKALDADSIYNGALRRRGVVVDPKREALVMYDLDVEALMRDRGFETIRPAAPLGALAERFASHRVHEVWVVDDHGRYDGVVDLMDIAPHMRNPGEALVVSDVETRSVEPLRPHQPLADALHPFIASGMDRLPVVDEDGVLVGVLHERDVLAAYDREVLRHDALLARFEHEDADRAADYVELPRGMVLGSVEVSGQLVGHSLAELKLPQRYGCTVLAIVSPDNRQVPRVSPRADRVLAKGEVLVVLGPEEDVARLGNTVPDNEGTVEIPRPDRP